MGEFNIHIDKLIQTEDITRLRALSRSLQSYWGNIKYVDYKQAEKDCERLASKILEVYSSKELESFCFMAIPRGGYIILGMLSYALNLKSSQLEVNKHSDQPLMIVDDISLTGLRLSKILDETHSSHVVIANLYSHPCLRRAILKQEPNVKNCFAAHDLKDRSQENHPSKEDYNAWKDLMTEKMGDRYWIGQTDLVGFAWSESDYPFWNPITKKNEDFWRSLPPHKCLKNKYRLGISPTESVKTEFHLSSSVVSGVFDDAIWLLQKDTGEIYSLNGIAAEIWKVLVFYGNLESSVKYLIKEYDVEESILNQDLERYVKDLLKNKILKKGAG